MYTYCIYNLIWNIPRNKYKQTCLITAISAAFIEATLSRWLVPSPKWIMNPQASSGVGNTWALSKYLLSFLRVPLLASRWLGKYDKTPRSKTAWNKMSYVRLRSYVRLEKLLFIELLILFRIYCWLLLLIELLIVFRIYWFRVSDITQILNIYLTLNKNIRYIDFHNLTILNQFYN